MTHQGTLPPIDEDVTLDDRSWFANRPRTLFRARTGNGGVWLMRRHPQGQDPDAYLRTVGLIGPPRDSDGELAMAWQPAAYPLLPLEQAQKAARKAPKTSR
jgi:hypothetical protein